MEYKGQLQGFPTEVVEKMLDEQERQTGKRDVSVFERNVGAARNSKGFNWRETQSGNEFGFWKDVIRNRNFDRFFEKYPKQQPMEQQNKYPMLMWVGDTEEDIVERRKKRVVFMEKCGKFLAWHASTFEEAEKTTNTFAWNFATPCKPFVRLTCAEIAAKFGVDEVEIVD